MAKTAQSVSRAQSKLDKLLQYALDRVVYSDHFVGYVRDSKRIESLLVVEPSVRGLRPVGRVELWKPGVLNGDAHEALLVLTRPSPCIRVRTGRSVRWLEPRLVATVKHFGRTVAARCEQEYCSP